MAKAKKKVAATDSIVEPIIRVDGETHLFEDLEKDGDMPILKSVGFARVHPSSRDWVSYVITSKGSEVLNMEVSEPNMKAIAVDDAKTSFVQVFMNDDGMLE